MKVQTSKGLIDRTLLEIREEITETDNARTVRTIWLFKGEEVRSDLHVQVLRGIESQILTGS